MAVLSEVMNGLGKAMVIPRSSMFLHARTLREADETLVPRDPLGRNRGAHLTPASILNLMFSVAAADPITTAPRLVRAWRCASYSPPMSDVLQVTPERKSILPGQSLALDLESLIDLLAKPSDREQSIRCAFDQDFRVTLTVGEAVVATVERPSLPQVDQYDAKSLVKDLPETQTFRLLGRLCRAIPMRRIVHLDFSYFEVAAELWADSLAYGAVYQPSLSEPLYGSSENGDAAAPGRAAASEDYQDRNSSPRTSTSLKVGLRDKILKPHAACGLVNPNRSGAS